MAGRTGTHDISTLLAVRTQSAASFGLSTIQEVLAADVEAHNALMRQALAEIAEITTDRQRISGTSSAGTMQEVDEYGRGPTQVEVPPETVGFPLRKFQYPIGWTREWEDERTPADFALATQNAEKAHRQAVLREIKRAIFGSANYTFTDDLVDKVSVAVKRLANADGAAIPDGPNGETFDGATHTHYLANATLTTTALDSLINTVVEHGFGGQIRVYINKAQEAAVRALTGFVAYVDPRVQYVGPNVPDQRLDITRTDNRAIGIYGAAEIWVKPWMIANYEFAFDVSAAAKPVAVRERTAGGMNLRIAADIDAHPLHARYMEAKLGAGVWTRTNGAVLYSNGGAYVVPTI